MNAYNLRKLLVCGGLIEILHKKNIEMDSAIGRQLIKALFGKMASWFCKRTAHTVHHMPESRDGSSTVSRVFLSCQRHGQANFNPPFLDVQVPTPADGTPDTLRIY